MNTTPVSNHRTMIILSSVLATVFLVLALNLVARISLMGGGIMGHMTVMDGGTMNDMIAASANMM